MCKSNIVNTFCRTLCFRFRVYLLLIVIAATAGFCLTLINVEYIVDGNASDYVSWYRTNRNISEFLQLDKDTYLIAVPEISYCTHFPHDVTVVYFVTSSPPNKSQRDAIRNTWGKTARPKPIFVTGFVPDPSVMDFLRNEAKLYGDIIIENFLDTYWNLTLKTGYIMKHFLRLCPESVYLMKTDDDMFVNTTKMENIALDLLINADGKLPIVGKVFEQHRPYRDPQSKWYIPYWMYNSTYFPQYVSGSGYLVPGFSVEQILTDASKVPMLSIEDVYFSGLVGYEVSGVPLKHHNQFSDQKPFLAHPCLYRNLGTAHGLNPNELYRVWSNNKKNEEKSCDGMINRIYDYLFSISS